MDQQQTQTRQSNPRIKVVMVSTNSLLIYFFGCDNSDDVYAMKKVVFLSQTSKIRTNLNGVKQRFVLWKDT